jgi:hypothetical protein
VCRCLLLLTVITTSLLVHGEALVFEGIPYKKIQTTEQGTSTNLVSTSDAQEFKVTIVSRGNKLYWKSRQGNEVLANVSGFFVTYTAINGSGYVRTMVPEARNLFRQMSSEDQEKQFLYVEHLIHQLGSITYYGR